MCWCLWMRVHMFVCVLVGSRVQGLQPSQWECTLVTSEVKAYWPQGYQGGVKGRSSSREPVATPQTYRLDSTVWTLHRTWQPNQGKIKHLIRPNRFINCINCIVSDHVCWIFSSGTFQLDSCPFCNSPGSFSPLLARGHNTEWPQFTTTKTKTFTRSRVLQ